MNLPNGLTLLRIFFVPVLIVILLTRSPNVELWGFPMHFEFWGVLILLMAAATDWALTTEGPVLIRVRISTAQLPAGYFLEDPVILAEDFRRWLRAQSPQKEP